MKRYYIIYILMMMLTFALVGCGKTQVDGDKQDFLNPDEIIYIAKYLDIPFKIECVETSDSYIYCVSDGNEIYRIDKNCVETYEKRVYEIPFSSYKIQKIQPGKNNKMYIVCSVYEEQDGNQLAEHIFLLEYDEQECISSRLEITDLLHQSKIRDTCVDECGNLVLLVGQQNVYIYEYEKNEIKKLSFDRDCYIEGIDSAADGSIYACSTTRDYDSHSNQIYLLSNNHELSEAKYDNVCSGNGFAVFGDKGFLTSFNNSLYLYDSETRMNTLLINWMNVGIDSSTVEKYLSIDDSKILIYSVENSDLRGGELSILLPVRRADYTEKQTISVATFTASNALNHAVSEFNRRNGAFRVEVKEYYDYLLDDSYGDSGQQEAFQKLHLDIISGKCPDVLNLSRSDLQQYAEKGLLVDLTEYLNESKILTFSDTMRKAYTIDDELVGLPSNIQLRTITGNKQIEKEDVHWNLQEFMDYISKNSSQTCFEVSSETLLEYCLTYNLDQYVEIERKKCEFAQPSFVDLLVFCKKYGKQGVERNNSIFSVWNHKGAQFHEVTINEPDALSFLRQEYQGKNFEVVGFPNDGKQKGIVIEEVDGCYSISTQCAYQDGAWQFLSLLLSDVQRPDFYNLRNGFPAAQESLKTYFDYITDETLKDNDRTSYSVDRDGLIHYIPSSSEIDELKTIIADASYPGYFDHNIMSIIYEEAKSFFVGDKTAEEVSELIQSRVSLYLNE